MSDVLPRHAAPQDCTATTREMNQRAFGPDATDATYRSAHSLGVDHIGAHFLAQQEGCGSASFETAFGRLATGMGDDALSRFHYERARQIRLRKTSEIIAYGGRLVLNVLVLLGSSYTLQPPYDGRHREP